MTFPPVLEGSGSPHRDDDSGAYGAGATRRRARLPLHRPVQITTSRGMGIAELLEIGEDGLRLRSPRPLDVDEEVQVHLTLPALSGHAARRCTLEARVVWRTGPLCGLLFTDAELELALDAFRALGSLAPISDPEVLANAALIGERVVGVANAREDGPKNQKIELFFYAMLKNNIFIKIYIFENLLVSTFYHIIPAPLPYSTRYYQKIHLKQNSKCIDLCMRREYMITRTPSFRIMIPRNNKGCRSTF